MEGQYILNVRRHCYHIRGGCHNATGSLPLQKWFESETELKSFDPGARLCSVCQKKREQNEKWEEIK